MMAKDVIGIIFSNSYDACIAPLTARRTMGSVPFGGRYRLIDFTLSNLVNSGVSKVGVITNSNFHSLMDHIGSGRPWDLSRKRDGMFLLPPFTAAPHENGGDNKIEALNRIMDFLAASGAEQVLLSDTNFICNMDFGQLFDFHTEKNADITMVYRSGKLPQLENTMLLQCDDNSRVKGISINQKAGVTADYAVNTILIRKPVLEALIGDAESFGYTGFERDLLQRNTEKLNIYGYRFDGWGSSIDSMETYFAANMALLDVACRGDLFHADRPVFTKVRNDMPVIYGIGSETGNSLIADGCIIEGTVKNSILSRGVRVAKGAVVENSIIMQDAFVGEGAKLDCVIMDKKTVITPLKKLSGDRSYPMFIGKGVVI